MKQKLLIKSSSITLMMIILLIFILIGHNQVLLLTTSVLVVVGVISLICMTDYVIHDAPLGLYQKRNQRLYQVIDYLQVVVSAFFLMQIIFTFWFFPATVNQTSMNPTLFEGERIIVKHETQTFNRFDIVIFRVDASDQVGVSLDENQELWVKRVIGLPGETIEFQDGLLYVNGESVYEPYLYNEDDAFYQGIYVDDIGTMHSYNSLTDDIELKDILTLMGLTGDIIPPDYYLLMGDNRVYSKDSRVIGLVHRSHIIGKGQYVIRNLFKWERIGG